MTWLYLKYFSGEEALTVTVSLPETENQTGLEVPNALEPTQNSIILFYLCRFECTQYFKYC